MIYGIDRIIRIDPPLCLEDNFLRQLRISRAKEKRCATVLQSIAGKCTKKFSFVNKIIANMMGITMYT
jgi:hypothetical protein